VIELVFIICLNTAPDVCEERSLVYEAHSGPIYCMMQAQPHLAEWAVQHPAYTVKHWKCLPGRRPDKA
jgi:hypothetical protein